MSVVRPEAYRIKTVCTQSVSNKTRVMRSGVSVSKTGCCGGGEGVHSCGLGRHVRGGHVERLKTGLRHALSVSVTVQNSFRGQNGIHF